MSFALLGLSEALLNAIEMADYTEPTAVQQKAIPALLSGRDLMVAAQTGTGKTASFALPILEHLFPVGQRQKQPIARQTKVLVLTPTRELAAQVHHSFQTYGKNLPLVSACIFGGVGMQPQIQTMASGVDLLVACPGRLLDLTEQGAIDLSAVAVLVLDEADRMLDMGFIHDVRKILSALPQKRQNLLFSATFSSEITALANTLLHDPERIEITPPNTTVATVTQSIYRCAAHQKRTFLAHLINTEKWEQVLVFTRTKHGANRLAEFLEKNGLLAAAIHGNKSQNARLKALNDFKASQICILVATDIAARGLDIDQLPHVVNFDLPHIAEDYVHRIGRTGRAGNSGEAVSLVAPEEEKLLRSIQRMIGQSILEKTAPDFVYEAAEPNIAEPTTQQSNVQHHTANAPKKPIAREKGRHTRHLGRGRRPRNNNPSTSTPTTSSPAPVSAQRDPEAFLDDDFDNFGNRADYVSPSSTTKKTKPQNRPYKNTYKGTSKSATGTPSNSVRHKKNKPTGRMHGQRSESLRDLDAPRVSLQTRPQKQPLILRKGERLPGIESPNSPSERSPNDEKPALLTRR